MFIFMPLALRQLDYNRKSRPMSPAISWWQLMIIMPSLNLLIDLKVEIDFIYDQCLIETLFGSYYNVLCTINLRRQNVLPIYYNIYCFREGKI